MKTQQHIYNIPRKQGFSPQTPNRWGQTNSHNTEVIIFISVEKSKAMQHRMGPIWDEEKPPQTANMVGIQWRAWQANLMTADETGQRTLLLNPTAKEPTTEMGAV